MAGSGKRGVCQANKPFILGIEDKGTHPDGESDPLHDQGSPIGS